MKIVITALLTTLVTCGCSSPRNPVPMNAYICPEGREAYIRNGFPKISFPAGTNDVITAIGHPEKVVAWRGPVPMFSFRSGKRLGTKWEYWIQWADFRDDRWLEFYFDLDEDLIRIEGNLDGEYFAKQKDGSSNKALRGSR